jgi:hypothetical protein
MSPPPVIVRPPVDARPKVDRPPEKVEVAFEVISRFPDDFMLPPVTVKPDCDAMPPIPATCIPPANVDVAEVPVRLKYVPDIPPANVEVAFVSPRMVVVADPPTER